MLSLGCIPDAQSLPRISPYNGGKRLIGYPCHPPIIYEIIYIVLIVSFVLFFLTITHYIHARTPTLSPYHNSPTSLSLYNHPLPPPFFLTHPPFH
ncbi:hypothetical protein L6452_09743 [Arctium lappa]|uniref:Uncharacterized protein n=1 Tax=Arctium lappa TaxID=4217 RepID=A0ACB9DKW8_ARCLA|nr:hypothetical protein L6452_09743 [Arctium lappa]